MNIKKIKLTDAALFLCARVFYFSFSIYLWIYKRWATNGDMDSTAHYITIVYCMVASIIVLVILPLKRNGTLWNIRGWALNKKRLICTAILSLYSGFCIIAYYALFTFSTKGVIKVFIFGLWCFPPILLYIWLIEYLKEKVCLNRRQEVDKDKYFFWKCFYYSNFAHRFYLCTLKIQYLAMIQLSKNSLLEHYAATNWDCSRDGKVLMKVSTSSSIFSSTRSQCSSKSFRNI